MKTCMPYIVHWPISHSMFLRTACLCLVCLFQPHCMDSYTDCNSALKRHSELIPPSHTRTDMANYLTSLLTWTAENDMQLNTSKTKEMLLGRLNPVNTPPFSQPQPVQSNESIPSSYLASILMMMMVMTDFKMCCLDVV